MRRTDNWIFVKTHWMLRTLEYLVPEGSDGGAERADDGTGLPELGEPVLYIRSRKADVLLRLVADLNLVDADPRRVSAGTPSARIRR